MSSAVGVPDTLRRDSAAGATLRGTHVGEDTRRNRPSPRAHRIDFQFSRRGGQMPKASALRCLIVLLMTSLPREAPAQAPPSPFAAIYPGRCETPASERTGDAGCYLLTTEPMDGLSEAVYWHLYTYPTLAIAQAARSRNGVAVQSHGKFWVFTVADQQWKPANGERVAVIGPLHLERGARYTARYMESILPPEMRGGRAYAFWTGGLLRVVRRAVPGDTRWHNGDQRRRERHHAHCPPDDSERRRGREPQGRVHRSPRQRPAVDHTRGNVDSTRSLSSMTLEGCRELGRVRHAAMPAPAIRTPAGARLPGSVRECLQAALRAGVAGRFVSV